ncbi:XkdX family protein [Staphylococcus xylosus]|uniref:XkdX family protein n=1 Tax=Staphylococcus xylosus TaxID=1288 RepID=UPI002DBA9A34|nr:XkdX family protein [Staphylococcus xylosus]MEB8121770.1 XkdX family protein [Staphylococcus xylosus]
MFPGFDAIKHFYDINCYTKTQIKRYVELECITKAQYKEITNEEYPESQDE